MAIENKIPYILSLIGTEITRDDINKIHRDYRNPDGKMTISFHGHISMTGRAIRLYENMMDSGASKDELHKALSWVIVCMDSHKHCLDYSRYRKEYNLYELEKKYLLCL